MNTILFYDSETTGFPSSKNLDDHASQPHLVQLAAHLVDFDTRKIIQSIDLIVEPDGWEIPEDTTEVHGISTEHALDVGMPEKAVVGILMQMWRGCLRVAHNEQFDAKILRIAAMRHQGMLRADTWRRGDSNCTSELSIDILKLPPSERMLKANRTGFKKPRLSEAYEYFTGKELVDAHTAIADVNACMEIYWAIQDLER